MSAHDALTKGEQPATGTTSATHAASPNRRMNPWHAFVLRIWKLNLKARVFINGWPALHHEATIGLTDQNRINEFLFADELNRIDVQLARFSRKHQHPVDHPQFDFELLKVPAGADLNSPIHQLLWFRYRPDTIRLKKRFTTVFEHWFPLRTGFGRWSFQDADPYATTDRGAVLDVVRSLFDAFERGDRNAAMDHLKPRLEDYARAEDRDVDDVVSHQHMLLEPFFATDELELSKVRWKDLEIRSACGGRLVSVHDADGNPPIRGRAGTKRFACDVVLSKIRGQWQIIR